MNNGLIVSVSPHYHKQGATTQRVMRDVLIALAPALVAGIINFGWRALLVTAVCAALMLLDGLTGETINTLQLNGTIEASPAVYQNMLVIGTTGKGTSFLYGVKID